MFEKLKSFIPRFLPSHGILDSVYCGKVGWARYHGPPRYVFLKCNHEQTFNYRRIDWRAGPGCYADNFEGKACIQCGAIAEEVQTF